MGKAVVFVAYKLTLHQRVVGRQEALSISIATPCTDGIDSSHIAANSDGLGAASVSVSLLVIRTGSHREALAAVGEPGVKLFGGRIRENGQALQNVA